MMATNQKQNHKTRKTNLLLLLAASLVFASCAKIQVQTPSSRFVSPEAQGKLLSGVAKFEQQSGTEATLDFTNDAVNNPLQLRNDITNPALSIDIGLAEKVDFLIRGNGYAESLYTVKFQLLGDSRQTAAKGNKSLAVMFGYSNATSSQSESDTSIFNTTTDSISADINQTVADFSVIYGQRTEADVLVYSSVQITKYDLKFKLDATSGSALDGQSFTLDTLNYGAALGAIRYFEKYYLNLEISAQRSNWTNNDALTYAFANIALGYKWD